MDLVFTQYHSPWTFLDLMIQNGQFYDFITTMYEQREERTRWELYVHKLGAFDDRTWTQFNADLDKGRIKQIERPSDEQVGNTIKTSFNMIKNFEI